MYKKQKIWKYCRENDRVEDVCILNWVKHHLIRRCVFQTRSGEIRNSIWSRILLIKCKVGWHKPSVSVRLKAELQSNRIVHTRWWMVGLELAGIYYMLMVQFFRLKGSGTSLMVLLVQEYFFVLVNRQVGEILYFRPITRCWYFHFDFDSYCTITSTKSVTFL